MKEARAVINKLLKTQKEFHTAELADALSKAISIHVDSDNARYWANRFTMDGFLDRRRINQRLYTYFKRPTSTAVLPSSFTIRKKGST